MADQLYLSLWFPNFRLQSLPAALVGVLRQFALIASDGHPASALGRVAAASAYPIDWTESPVYQRLFVLDDRAEDSADSEDSIIENAVAEATEQLHEDTAYEFEMRWMLWLPEPNTGPARDDTPTSSSRASSRRTAGVRNPRTPATGLDSAWRLEPSRVRITGFGPDFDEGSYEQNGHIRADFGLDTPWTFESQTFESQTFESQTSESPDDNTPHSKSQPSKIQPIMEDSPGRDAAQRIQQNVEKLLAFTLSVEKHCGISSRLLWTESGEPLAEKLIARLQRLN